MLTWFQQVSKGAVSDFAAAFAEIELSANTLDIISAESQRGGEYILNGVDPAGNLSLASQEINFIDQMILVNDVTPGG